MYISDKDADKAVDSTNNFYIMVGAGCGVIALIAIIVAIVYLRGPKPIRNNERLRYVDTKNFYQKERDWAGSNATGFSIYSWISCTFCQVSEVNYLCDSVKTS